MRNAEIAAALRELGILYELDGADRFRVLAYREAARTVAQSPVSIEQLAEEGRLTELPAIGKTLAQKIETLIETGSIPSADKLKAKFPATLVEVTRVPGLGAKTAKRIYDEIGVENLLWATDYPHPDCTWPESQQVIRTHFDDVPVEEMRLMVGGNAARIYRM